MYKKAFSLLLSLTALSAAIAVDDKAILEVSHDGAGQAKAFWKEAKEKAFLRLDRAKAAWKEAREEPEEAVDAEVDLKTEIKGRVRVHQAKAALKETKEATIENIKEAMTDLKDAAAEAKALLAEIKQEHDAAVDAQQIFPVTDTSGKACLCTCKGGLLIDVLPYEALTPTKTLCFSAVFAQFALVDRPAVFQCTPFPECPVKNQWKIPGSHGKDEPATSEETVAAALPPQDETTAAAADPQQRK
jgi:hypothetical protein